MEAAAVYHTGESKSLAQRVTGYLKKNGKTKAQLAIELNYSRTTISRYLSGRYDSNCEELEARLEEYLKDKTSAEPDGNQEPGLFKPNTRKEFYNSHDALGVIGVCSSCQQDMGLGVVVGKTGQGKTHALKQYAKMPRVAYVECDDTMASRDLVKAMERILGIPQTYGTIWDRVSGIREFFNVNQGYLLIVDEADKLLNKYTQRKMEILRRIFDQADVGVLVGGEPKLEAMLKAYLPRFANRVDFYYSLKGLSKQEVEEYLGGFNVEPDALAELTTRACNPQTGCFRLLDRTLKNAIRIMNENGQDTITLKFIAQASNMMML